MAKKKTICDWIKVGWSQLQAKTEMVKKSFLVSGISNALDGTQNSFIHCAKKLNDMQLSYLNESTDDPSQTSDAESSDTTADDEADNSDSD
uniref:DDE-1 domain-containing protein n=1 Tax=Amphimedon queenslandica TaxID=400682 RepID=A0A1X7UBM7_AMPQE